jgi:hypothetical protein
VDGLSDHIICYGYWITVNLLQGEFQHQDEDKFQCIPIQEKP